MRCSGYDAEAAAGEGDDAGDVAGVHIQHLKCLPFSKTQKPFMTVRS